MAKLDIKSLGIDFEHISNILKPLSHPHRLEMIIGLFHNGCTVTQCQERMGLPQSTISQHLRVLKDAGILKGRRKGTEVCYEVIDPFALQIIDLVEKK
ncbi:MAG: metalloregulator ArsR/SmtB family transcription factor [Candidatus Delongbacteria bacterium]|jgi:DNA-binding transcriptional ArsR family regulator|nr:metalloregulator ArsR/SmtB family transcription factor [Candidatus Delongbacteria bacterium]